MNNKKIWLFLFYYKCRKFWFSYYLVRNIQEKPLGSLIASTLYPLFHPILERNPKCITYFYLLLFFFPSHNSDAVKRIYIKVEKWKKNNEKPYTHIYRLGNDAVRDCT